jgi:hypothetical protein
MTFILLGDDTDDEMEHEVYDELSRAIEAMIISLAATSCTST